MFIEYRIHRVLFQEFSACLMGLGQSCWRDAGKTSFFALAESNFSARARCYCRVHFTLRRLQAVRNGMQMRCIWQAISQSVRGDASLTGSRVGKRFFNLPGAQLNLPALQVSARVRVHKSACRSHRVHYYEIFSDVTLAPSARVYADWFFRALG